MFLPATLEEIYTLGWNQPDVILVTGDAYIDSPFMGIAVVGHWLSAHGYKVAVLSQPDVQSKDIVRLGEPRLFWGVTSGSVDSMVANKTALGKPRRKDDYTPGGENNRRPDRAVIIYSNLIRQHFKHTVPIVLGGIEASLRRIAHYDYWQDRIRASILLDAKADLLIYGMAEKAIVEVAERLENDHGLSGIRGTCEIKKSAQLSYLELPAYEEVKTNPLHFKEMFRTFYLNQDPLTAKGLFQKHGERFLIHHPPQANLTSRELDQIHNSNYERAVHPHDAMLGEVRATHTIDFSISTHRGCYGECHFCAIAIHQGRIVISRSEDSIVQEAEKLTAHPRFKGIITDVGGPTANMYGFECAKKLRSGACKEKSCLTPSLCPLLRPTHEPLLKLLARLRKVSKVKRVFVASGVRTDLVLSDQKFGMTYLEAIATHHTSGQLKIAPEHTVDRVVRLMGKPAGSHILQFKKAWDHLQKRLQKKQFLTYYLIAAYPGCTLSDMQQIKKDLRENHSVRPEQVQVFTPTPSTWATVMYVTGHNPFNGEKIFVEKSFKGRELQKNVLYKDYNIYTNPANGKKQNQKRRKYERK